MDFSLQDHHIATPDDVAGALHELRSVLSRLEAGELEDSTSVYDHERRHTEKFMISGNGPSAWVWFVFGDDGKAIDHAYIEYVGAHAPVYVNISPHVHELLLDALRTSAKNGVDR